MAGRKKKSAVKAIAAPVDNRSPLNLRGNPIVNFLGGAVLIGLLMLVLAATLTANHAAGFERITLLPEHVQ